MATNYTKQTERKQDPSFNHHERTHLSEENAAFNSF